MRTYHPGQIPASADPHGSASIPHATNPAQCFLGPMPHAGAPAPQYGYYVLHPAAPRPDGPLHEPQAGPSPTEASPANGASRRALTPYGARLGVAFAMTVTAGIALNVMLLQRKAPEGSDQAIVQRGGSGRGALLDGVLTGNSGGLGNQVGHAGHGGPPIKTAGLPPQPAPPMTEDIKRWQGRLKQLEAEAHGAVAGAVPIGSANAAATGEGGAGEARMLEPAIAHRLDSEPVTPVTQLTVRAIQRELTVRGYDPGPVDGNIGLLTHAAIMAFEHDEGIVMTGEPSERLLRRMILGTTGLDDGDTRTGSRADNQTAERLIRGVQDVLNKLKYAPGPASGTLSEETARAIREFEMDQGLVPTGRVSGRLIVRLARASGKAFVLPVR